MRKARGGGGGEGESTRNSCYAAVLMDERSVFSLLISLFSRRSNAAILCIFLSFQSLPIYLCMYMYVKNHLSFPS
ncbi:hypothetical protein CSUI_009626 [Cystoisospora suis]|uniref:Transmembrane protein n=1 Tax=Cystoisospora suis TaxID=483139 RepID=A0A2C6KJL9_9APIC|nr:hypothetical protein CSUI_009626 [Cystoisospora suis]